MAPLQENSTILSSLIKAALSRTTDSQREMNMSDTYNFDNIITTSKLDTFVNASHNISVTTASSIMSTLVTTEVPEDLSSQYSDSSTTVKITTLMIITAFVLVISYCSVVRLFLGYADRKDDVYPDGPSDDDDDSAVIKRMPEYEYGDYD